MRFSEEQKKRFEDLTNIDDIDIEDDNVAAARTCIDSLVNEEAARDLLDSLNRLYDELDPNRPPEGEEGDPHPLALSSKERFENIISK